LKQQLKTFQSHDIHYGEHANTNDQPMQTHIMAIFQANLG